jgi:hypothetical protein
MLRLTALDMDAPILRIFISQSSQKRLDNDHVPQLHTPG